MENQKMFQCAVVCAEVCCTGATMLTLDEVGKLYRISRLLWDFANTLRQTATIAIFSIRC